MRIINYSLKRILLLIPILLGISFVTFTVTRIIPGDPLRIILSPYAKDEDVQRVREEKGLDEPLVIQYGIYLADLFQGDLGYSYRTRNTVVDDIQQRFPATIELTTLSLLIATATGVPLGVLAAVNRDKWFDHIIRVISVGGVSIPIFWTGVVLIFIFYFHLRIAPPPIGRMGFGDIPPDHITGMYILDSILTRDWTALGATLRFIALPAITLSFAMLAPILRITRTSMLEVLSSEYIRTARSLGLASNTIIFRNALKNALLPVITSIGQIFGWSLGGEVLVEVVFSWPGIGYYAVNSILNTDYAPVQGFVLLTATIYVLVNLAVDMLYTAIDPRISY